MNGFLASEMRSVGSLSAATVASGTAVFSNSGEQVAIPANSTWVVVYFQATMLSGGSGNSAVAQIVDLSSSKVYATLVLTQAGTFAIENQGREFGPVVAPRNGSVTLTARAIDATDDDEIAILANLEQVYTDPLSV